LRLIAVEALGSEARAHNMQYFNKPPRCEYRLSAVHDGSQPTPPHQDGYYWCHVPVPGRESGVTMWLALDDADEGNGCLRYVRGSSHVELRPHGFSGIIGFSQTITDYGEHDKDAEMVMCAQPGDLLIHNATLVHRADANASEERTRRALGAIFFSESAVVDEGTFEARKAEIARRAAQLCGQQQ
jgi:phytanoyl-CoA hydroxylase